MLQRFRSGVPHEIDAIKMEAYEGVARGVVIDRLRRKCGLQLKLTLSRDKDEVLCRVRASESLLRKEADCIGYKLQFQPEVDPGMKFWTKEELQAENEDFTRDEAEVILERMFEAGAIPPQEARIFESENREMWSRRIHTLQRFADKVHVTNPYPLHSNYEHGEHLQHLYRSWNSARGTTLFRPVDRIKLVLSIMDEAFDCGKLQQIGVLNAYLPLHDANRNDPQGVTLDKLKDSWTTLCGYRPGNVVLLSDVMENRQRWFFMRPLMQPLQDIRDYFGEKVAMYFAWLGFYSYAITFPAAIGLAMFIVEQNYPNQALIPGFTTVKTMVAVFCGVISLWTVFFTELWDRENKKVALRWGMVGFEEDLPPRPQFYGSPKQSPITNRMELFYPSWKRTSKKCVSMLVIALGIVVLLVCLAEVFWLRHHLVTKHHYKWGGPACSVVQAVQIQIVGYIFQHIAEVLNDWENHRTQLEYEDSLIFKIFLFQMFNNYGALYYTAFIKPFKYGCDPPAGVHPKAGDITKGDCLGELRQLIVIIFIVRMLMNFVELGLPWLKRKRKIWAEERTLRERAGEDGVALQIESMEAYEEEIKLEEYDDTFSDYAGISMRNYTATGTM